MNPIAAVAEEAADEAAAAEAAADAAADALDRLWAMPCVSCTVVHPVRPISAQTHGGHRGRFGSTFGSLSVRQNRHPSVLHPNPPSTLQTLSTY